MAGTCPAIFLLKDADMSFNWAVIRGLDARIHQTNFLMDCRVKCSARQRQSWGLAMTFGIFLGANKPIHCHGGCELAFLHNHQFDI